MRVLISADIEGISGVFHAEQTRAGNPEYENSRRLMTAEVNAVVEGSLAGGATEIILNDSHGSFRNLVPELIHPRARVIQGKPRMLGMMSGVESGVDGVMMVGYHARSQSRGILAHTINSFAFARIWLNAQELGEAGIYGALAAEFRVPVIFASGDDVFVQENRPLFPHAEFVTVKTAQGHGSGQSVSPAEARSLLAQGARSAIERAARATLFTIPQPVTCRLQTQSPALADMFCQLPILHRIDGVVLEFSVQSVQHAIRILNCLSAMSFILRN